MHGANFYQNATLIGHISAEQIEFFIAELDLVLGYLSDLSSKFYLDVY